MELVAARGKDAKVLAGGQSLLPLLAMRRVLARHLIDLQNISELREIRRLDGRMGVGAMVRQREVERDPAVPALVRTAVRHIGSFEIRNRGTVGGSLAHLDPAAEWPALVLAMNAVLVAVSVRGRREVRAAAFVRDAFRSALEPDEILVEVRLPDVQKNYGFAEVARRGAGDFALAGAVCHGTAVVVFGAGSRPQRLPAVEDLLGEGRPENVVAVAASEIQATSDYRRQVGAALVARVVAEAAHR